MAIFTSRTSRKNAVSNHGYKEIAKLRTQTRSTTAKSGAIKIIIIRVKIDESDFRPTCNLRKAKSSLVVAVGSPQLDRILIRSQRRNETDVCKTNKDDDSSQGSQDMVHGILGERKSKEYVRAEKSHKWLRDGDWSSAKKDVSRDVCLDENEGNTSPRISRIIDSFFSLRTSTEAVSVLE
ncbi:hypothetical protein V1478_000276 [Vespula squamosa]|uniref:Uncharacterized protein n=1 Tax=Vespula squamosa TaxID=30214 RepID=A0ABD2C561_VESSQ